MKMLQLMRNEVKDASTASVKLVYYIFCCPQITIQQQQHMKGPMAFSEWNRGA